MTRRRLLRGLAAVVGFAVLVSALTVRSAVPPTDAAFADAEYTRATFTGFTVPVPTITSCTIQNSLGVFQSATLVWTSPYPGSGVRLNLTIGGSTVTVPAVNISTTGPSAGLYTHTSVLTSSLLSGLLGTILNVDTTMTVQNLLSGSLWVSVGASRVLRVQLLGATTCT